MDGRSIGVEVDLDDPALAPPGEVETGVDGQAMEPGIEPVWVAQAREVAPGANVRILDRVPREIGVPDDEASRGIEPRDGRVDEQR